MRCAASCSASPSNVQQGGSPIPFRGCLVQVGVEVAPVPAPVIVAHFLMDDIYWNGVDHWMQNGLSCWCHMLPCDTYGFVSKWTVYPCWWLWSSQESGKLLSWSGLARIASFHIPYLFIGYESIWWPHMDCKRLWQWNAEINDGFGGSMGTPNCHK